MTISAHPLTWPAAWPRTEPAWRKEARFARDRRDLTVRDGVARVLLELDRLGVRGDDVIISTNIETRMDGLPRSDRGNPGDPGAAVYWEAAQDKRRVMAIDRYTTVAGNLGAIAATLEAMRAIDRHGGAQILERAFTGFTALPAPGAEKHWRDILGPCQTLDEARSAYRRQAAIAHPDRGGSDHQMAELNRAWQQAQGALS